MIPSNRLPSGSLLGRFVGSRASKRSDLGAVSRVSIHFFHLDSLHEFVRGLELFQCRDHHGSENRASWITSESVNDRRNSTRSDLF
jgi:hypothetical protein